MFADNDALVASLGEAVYGWGGNDNFIYITWGTGIGGALVSKENGAIMSSRIDWRTYLTGIEEKCGGKGLEKRFKKEFKDFSENDWNLVVEDLIGFLVQISSIVSEKNIVLGGGITDKQKDLLKKNILNISDVKISLSSFGDDVGLYGAFALIKV